MSSVDRGAEERGDSDARDPRHLAGSPSGDRQLLRAAALGDVDAWAALVEEYADTVWSTCLRCGLRADEAAAVSNLVWLSLVDAIPHLDVPLGTWLVASATHEAHLSLGRAADRPGAGRERDRRSFRRGVS